MSKSHIRAALAAFAWAGCMLAYSVAMEHGMVFWACVHAITGAWAAACVGWHAAAAEQERRRNRRRRAMQGWDQLPLKHRKDGRA